MVWLLAIGALGATPSGLPPEADGCAGSARSALFGCYEVTAAPAALSLKLGSLIAFTEEGAVVRNPDVRVWARLPITWSLVEPTLLEGNDAGAHLAVKPTAPGRVEIVEDGRMLAVAERLSPERAVAAAKTFHDLPSLEALRERLRACLAEYVKLLPEDRDKLGTFDPMRCKNTASAAAIIRLAQVSLTRECAPVPGACAIAPQSDQDVAELKKAEQVCRVTRREPKP